MQLSYALRKMRFWKVEEHSYSNVPVYRYCLPVSLSVCMSVAHHVFYTKCISKLSKKLPFFQNCHCFGFTGETLYDVFQKPFFFLLVQLAN